MDYMMLKLKLVAKQNYEHKSFCDFIETLLYSYDVILELRNHKVVITWAGFNRNTIPYHHTITNLSESKTIQEYDVIDYANIGYCYIQYMKELYPSLDVENFPWSEVSIGIRN